MLYADYAYYKANGGRVSQREILPLLNVSKDTIDTLVFNRIDAIGWDNLTDFQKEKVRAACCAQADFLYENGEAVESALRHYSINGVTMEFGNDSLYKVYDGVAVCNRAWNLLRMTGLTARLARYREVEPCAGLV